MRQHQCSSLKGYLNRIHVVGEPKFHCGSPIEAIHYFLDCQLYSNQRISLFNDLIVWTWPWILRLILKHYCLEIIHIYIHPVYILTKLIQIFVLFFFPLFVLIIDSIVYLLFLILCFTYVLLSLYIMSIVHARRGLNI